MPPIVIVFLVLQRYFVEGIAGAIKGRTLDTPDPYRRNSLVPQQPRPFRTPLTAASGSRSRSSTGRT